MTTLKDIARHLNLSVTQVSRALNGHSDVSSATSERVRQAASKLNYHPNVTARKLVAGRSGIVALVALRPDDAEHDGHFVETIAGLSEAFAERGMQFILRIIPEGADPAPVHRRLVQAGVIDGFVLTSLSVDDPRVAFLKAHNVPFVAHGRIPGVPDYAFFDIDNDRLSAESAQALIDRGHRRIALLNGQHGYAFAAERLRGFRQAVSVADIGEDEALTLAGPMTSEFGRQAVQQLWSGDRPPPTALICSSVRTAAGVYQALAQRGLSVPDDVSVIAHDDSLPGQDSARFDPPLSVTWAPLSDSWQPLASLLDARLSGGKIRDLQITARHQLILRGSVSVQ